MEMNFILLFYLYCQISSAFGKKPVSYGQKSSESVFIDNDLPTVDLGSPVQKLIIHKDYVWVGAKNYIFRLSSNLSLIAKKSFGPILDNLECPPEPLICNKSRKIVNSDIKIFTTHPGRNYLFFCLSTSKGMCQIILANRPNIQTLSIGEKSYNTNYVSGYKSSYAIFVPYKNTSLLMVANQYDGRPIEYNVPAITSRILKPVPHLRFEFTASKSYVDITDRFRTSYNANYFYGFEHGNFFYFLKYHFFNGKHDTRLIRICKDDHSFTSLTEVSLHCATDIGLYDIGKAAYVGFLDKIFMTQHSLNENSEVLFVSFQSSQANPSASRFLGSSICAFPLNRLNQYIDSATELCYLGDTRFNLNPLYLHSNHTKCHLEPYVKCHHSFNPYILIEESFKGYMLDMLKTVVTSFITQIQGKLERQVFVLGTEDGVIMKKYQGDVLHSIKVSDESITNIVPDNNNIYAYISTGSKLIKYPFGSCSLYSRCDSCLSRKDVLRCGWCDKCVNADKCNNVNSCKPDLIDVFPKKGPSQGTDIILKGYSFGYADNAFINVTIGKSSCIITNRTSNEISCKAKNPFPIEKSKEESIKICVEDNSYINGYDISGCTDNVKFLWVEPLLKNCSPNIGPLQGGTQITCYGNHLNSGSQRKITVNEVLCKIIFINETIVQCVTGELSENKNELKEYVGSIRIEIDNIVLEIPSSFHYVPKPNISSIEPQILYAYKNYSIKIKGENLDSFILPKLEISKKIKNDSFSIENDCNPSKSFELTCDIPMLPSRFISISSPFYANGMIKDDLKLHNHSFKIKYLPNPVFEEYFTKENRILFIYGKWFSPYANITITKDKNESIPCHIAESSDKSVTCESVKDLTSGAIFYNDIHIGSIPTVSSSFSFYYVFEYVIFIAVTIIILGVLFYRIIIKISKKKRIEEQEKSLKVHYKGNIDDDFDRRDSGFDFTNNSIKPLLDDDLYSDDEVQSLIISTNNLKIGNLLGQGHYARVYKAILYDNNVSTEVAVKMMNKSNNYVNRREIIKEGLLMLQVPHKNVLNLIGIVRIDHFPLLITPFMCHGDLENYLRNKVASKTIEELLDYAIQVADGMNALANQKIIHRDLAARNCMLDNDNVVKIADFGLARDIYESNVYITDVNRPKPLPFPWMAIESMIETIFTTQSDVWSFGVFLWEILSMCRDFPYNKADVNVIRELILSGRRLPKHSHCPLEVYVVMLSCWNSDPSERPSFANLAESLRSIISNRRDKELEYEITSSLKSHYETLPTECYYNDFRGAANNINKIDKLYSIVNASYAC